MKKRSIKEPKDLVTKNQHLTLDVVCGMNIIAEKAKLSSIYHDATYYFCSHSCKQHFDNNPEHYVWEK